VTLEMGHATLPVGATLPGPTDGALRVATIGPELIRLGEGSGGTFTNLDSEPAVVYVLTLRPVNGAGGTPAPDS
jgi:hypothetical protein